LRPDQPNRSLGWGGEGREAVEEGGMIQPRTNGASIGPHADFFFFFFFFDASAPFRELRCR
jgi:hypothetical protein